MNFKNILVTVVIGFSASTSYADIRFISPTGLTVKVTAAEVVDQKTKNIPVDESGATQIFLTQANLQLSLSITDVGCSLNLDSPITASFDQGRLLSDVLIVESKVNLYVPIDGMPGRTACAGRNSVVRTEIVKVPLVNGIGSGASKDVTYKYIFNSLTSWGVKPIAINVVVNQAQKTTVVNLNQE